MSGDGGKNIRMYTEMLVVLPPGLSWRCGFAVSKAEVEEDLQLGVFTVSR